MPTLANTSLFTFKAGGTGSATDYVVRLSNRYSDAIAAILGLTKVASGSAATGMPVTVNQAISAGLLIKLRMNYRKSGGKKRGAVNLVCDLEKVQNAVSSLTDMDYDGGKIISVKGVPRVKYR
ncbi:hypothetical protein PCC9214_05349 [Planktothrix tepida]|uniref:Uncharacterized protein n=1 Tax=Planktothrix tepida PCC 9214 TaxID=671072 RepID=A0A1J1LJR2_9CYAN|nr:hypothetical protein [Planktothrix tepida]CAD5984874.1 hypothetical protein PCC9214_05311 [Planktothrix tepida]CAD5985146.1 hypothetical protein PCC9214_05349 [Planktothrix tepida]CUR32140.1 conserved hypothetical protein [Planktothrix tepida PCC 9214]